MSTARTSASWRADLHLRLSRRYARELRATRASAAAFAVSLIAWLLGAPPATHAVVVLAAAAAAAALPARALLGRAFGWIGSEAGLAYQTFVEHAERPDPYGLLAAAEVHARLSVRGVSAPPRSSWWLPLAAGALAVWLVASFVGGLLTLPFGGGAGGPGAAQQVPPAPPAAIAPDAQDDEAPDEVDATPPAGQDPQPPAGPQDAGRPPDEPDAAGEGVGQEALDRFLDNLRERPTEVPDAAAELARELGEAPPDDVRPGVRELDTERTDEDAEARSTLRPGGDEGDPEDEVDEDGAGAAGADDGEDGAGEEDGEAPGPGEDEGDPAPDPAADPGADPGGEGEGEGEDPGQDEGVVGEGDDAAFDAGDGQDAGIGVGRPDDADTVEVQPLGPEEALEGMLLPGEETPGGRVRLPGQDGGVVPEGVPVERYERAVEQAITDGSVPVPYQEIIRNYFR